MERNEILQAIQELSVKERMELLSEAAKENDATVVLGNGNELVKAAKASRAVGSVQNTTPNYGLPLPSAGEVMAYQDFINTPMGIIDTALKNNADEAALNATGLAQANVNISAADTKISNIQTNLNEWNIPGIIQEQQSMDVRLEAVEETTMEFVHPDIGLLLTDSISGNAHYTIRTGGLLFIMPANIKTNEEIILTDIQPYITPYGGTGNSYNVCELGSLPGNVFGLGINKNYWMGSATLGYHKSSSDPYQIVSASVYAKFNGSETLIYFSSGSIYNNIAFVCSCIIPLGIL